MDAVLTRESPPIIDISDLFVGDYLLFPNQAFILLEITCTYPVQTSNYHAL